MRSGCRPKSDGLSKMLASDLPGICRVMCQIEDHFFIHAFDDTAEARAATRVLITQIKETGETPMTWDHAAWLQRQVNEALPIRVTDEVICDEP